MTNQEKINYQLQYAKMGEVTAIGYIESILENSKELDIKIENKIKKVLNKAYNCNANIKKDIEYQEGYEWAKRDIV